MPAPFAVCISGHRPAKLPTGAALRMLQSLLYREIETAILDGADTFYCGMAPGVDVWAADMILHMRTQFPQVQLIAVLPIGDRLRMAQGAERYHLNSLLENADAVHTISEHYTRECFRDRNRYMVAHSQRLIALVMDVRSGTGQTIRLAERAGLEMRVLSWEKALRQKKPAHEFFRCAE